MRLKEEFIAKCNEFVLAVNLFNKNLVFNAAKIVVAFVSKSHNNSKKQGWIKIKQKSHRFVKIMKNADFLTQSLDRFTKGLVYYSFNRIYFVFQNKVQQKILKITSYDNISRLCCGLNEHFFAKSFKKLQENLLRKQSKDKSICNIEVFCMNRQYKYM